MAKKLSLSQHLRDARTKRRLSVADLAATLGVTPPAVYHWENGVNHPRPDHLTALCKALKLPLRATRELAAG